MKKNDAPSGTITVRLEGNVLEGVKEIQRVFNEKVEELENVSDGYHTFNELYRHRYWLFLNLMYELRSVSWAAEKHADGTMFEGSFVAGIDLPSGQITYHLPIWLWDIVERMGVTQKFAPTWDGHLSHDVIERLRERLKRELE